MKEICIRERSLQPCYKDRYLFAGIYFLGSIVCVVTREQEQIVFGKFEGNSSGELQTIEWNTGNLLLFMHYCSRQKKCSFLSCQIRFSYRIQLSMTRDCHYVLYYYFFNIPYCNTCCSILSLFAVLLYKHILVLIRHIPCSGVPKPKGLYSRFDIP